MAARPQPRSKHRARWRRGAMAALALGMLGLELGPGCAAGFDPPSKVNTFRVLAVTADTPYALPDPDPTDDQDVEVHFTMTYTDAAGDEARPVEITWLGGCFDPEGDQYYACYDQLAKVLQGLAAGTADADGLVGRGQFFTLKLPSDIVTRRPPPAVGTRYGIAYVFFAACAGGTVKPVAPEGTGRAGSFPLGCFDAEGNRLGADSFVPGYTQIYVFEDGRTNPNPVATGIELGVKDEARTALPEDFAAIPTVKACPLTEDERRIQGCGAEDPYASCQTYDLQVTVQSPVADEDEGSKGPDGEPLTESVWVDYYIDGGDLDADVKLVSDPLKGPVDEAPVRWVPPAEPGLVTVWAVVHDARGGSSVVERFIRVE